MKFFHYDLPNGTILSLAVPETQYIGNYTKRDIEAKLYGCVGGRTALATYAENGEIYIKWQGYKVFLQNYKFLSVAEVAERYKSGKRVCSTELLPMLLGATDNVAFKHKCHPEKVFVLMNTPNEKKNWCRTVILHSKCSFEQELTLGTLMELLTTGHIELIERET